MRPQGYTDDGSELGIDEMETVGCWEAKAVGEAEMACVGLELN